MSTTPDVGRSTISIKPLQFLIDKAYLLPNFRFVTGSEGVQRTH